MYRFLLKMDDDTLMYVNGGVQQWVRNEALASVEQVVITDNPISLSKIQPDVAGHSLFRFFHKEVSAFTVCSSESYLTPRRS